MISRLSSKDLLELVTVANAIKVRRHARKARTHKMLAVALSCSVMLATGCSTTSNGSGWWSTTGGSIYGASATAAKSVGGSFKSMGSTVSSAFTKTKNVIVSPFKGSDEAVPGDKEDPTSLASIPGKLTPELWVTHGQLAESQGQHAKALESYNKALAAEPNNIGALVSAARLYDRQGDAKQSVQYFQKALAVNPNDASIHNDLGLAYSKAGNAAAAKDSLAKAASIEPNNVRYRNNLATVLVENGQANEAVTQLQQVLPPAVAHYNVAYLHFTKQNLAAAQQELQAALQIDPNLQQARDLYSRIGGGQSVAQLTNAYQAAGNIYQAVQGVAGQGTVSATPVSNPSGTMGANVPAPGAGSVPTQAVPNWLNSPAMMSTATP